MNKTAKIILAVFAAVIVLIAAVVVIMPSGVTRWYLSGRKAEYPKISQTVSEEYEHYDEKIPDSFGEVSMYGVSLSLPENAERVSDDQDNGGYHIFKSADESLSVNFISRITEGTLASYAYYDYLGDERLLKSDFRALKADVEMNDYALTSFIRNFTANDVKGGGIKAFWTAVRYANIKETVADYEQSWNYETEDAVGFVDLIGCENGIYSYNLVLYDKDDLNEVHLVKLESSSEKLIWQIIDSAKIKTE